VTCPKCGAKLTVRGNCLAHGCDFVTRKGRDRFAQGVR
jgi:hypothetical protein